MESMSQKAETGLPANTRKEIEALIERFGRNIEVYRKSSYLEEQLRIEFINPFFDALGWDIANRQGFAEQYKEVIHEDAIKVGGATKAPDYSFRIGGVRKFFLEAKKPSHSIKTEPSPAYQLRRYAWSAKLPLSILTDFEELAVYDCRIRPKPEDKPDVARIRYLDYQKYLDELDWIYGTFSKHAVLKGSFDRYVESAKGKRGTSEVDSEFLKEIETWRDNLARNIALRNSRLSVHDLNFAVQRTIDRIIFLRMAEDRGLEPYQQLQAIINAARIYKRLIEIFYRTEDKYNSGLFDFKADRLTPGLKIDDKILKDIIIGLYYPKCPYEFSVLAADILGNIYEQFLGKVIRLTKGHHARVEEKPEVKKAGGVYYTPKYIVDYIVRNTVGKLIEGDSHHRDTEKKDYESKSKKISLTPNQISKLRILDPACGSGSFLLGAYLQRLFSGAMTQ
jgi:predicted type IV restriction endonuclease